MNRPVDFSLGARLEVLITAADVGRRVSVRRLLDGVITNGTFTETVGVLTSWDDGVLTITRKNGESVRFAESELVAGKVVPTRHPTTAPQGGASRRVTTAPARRRGPATSYRELARVAARAWRPVESERLGDWELRAAAGFTRRANSVLPLGTPGLPLDEALDVVRRWYGERGLPAYVQTATGAEGTEELLCAELERRGWVREVTAGLWVGALAPVADRAEGAGVVLSRRADEAWLARYQRKGVDEVALKVLSSGPSVWFASIPGAGGSAPAAIGRCVVDGRWAGFAAVEVDPSLRRRGLATEVMAALAQRTLEEGASAAWLQVEADNAGARELYGGLGFAAHHAYHHYRAPDADDPAPDTDDPATGDGTDTAGDTTTAEGATAGGTTTADGATTAGGTTTAEDSATSDGTTTDLRQF